MALTLNIDKYISNLNNIIKDGKINRFFNYNINLKNTEEFSIQKDLLTENKVLIKQRIRKLGILESYLKVIN